MPNLNPTQLLKSSRLISFANDSRKWIQGAMRGTYSQDGEDILLKKLFPKRSGVYVDVGANHPFKLSNTYLLYRDGWRGICVEPMPFLYSALAKWRSKDVCLNMGIGRQRGELKFHVMHPHVLSTFREDAAAELIASGRGLEVECINVQVLPLSIVLDKYLNKRSVDLLCVDTEGFDFEVLSSNDWARFRPEIVLVEKGSPGLGKTIDPVAKLLESNGYMKIEQTLHNDFYQRRE